MVVTFSKDYLRELYFEGRCSEKSRRFQPEIVRGYVKAIKSMVIARNLHDLSLRGGLNLEPLQGKKAGTYSVRANRQYRVEFEVLQGDGASEPCITVCNILELSNHYK